MRTESEVKRQLTAGSERAETATGAIDTSYAWGWQDAIRWVLGD